MNSDTMKFSIDEERAKEIRPILQEVYSALLEKGYNPIIQIVGYILSEDPGYITNHKNARALIRRVDRYELLSELVKSKLEGEYADLPFVVYGPFEAQIYKLNEKYRMRMMIKCKLNSRTRRMFSEVLSEFAENRKVILSIDLNPLTV